MKIGFTGSYANHWFNLPQQSLMVSKTHFFMNFASNGSAVAVDKIVERSSRSDWFAARVVTSWPARGQAAVGV